MLAYTFQALSAENMHHTIPLFHKVFQKKVNLLHLQEKYNNSHLIEGLFGHFAFLNDEAIGFVGVVPNLFEYKGKFELAAQFVDAMILKEHRNWVLFSRLMNLNYELLIRAGFKFAWNMGNNHVDVLFSKRFKWTAVNKLNAYVIPVANKYMMYMIKKLFSTKGKDIHNVFDKVSCEPQMFHSFTNKDVVKVFRNKEHLEYKKHNYGFFISFHHCTFWIKQQGGAIYIGDIGYKEEMDMAIVLVELKKMARKAKAAEIIFQTSPGSDLDKYFSSNYKSFPSWTQGYYNFNSEFPLDKLCCTWADMDMF